MALLLKCSACGGTTPVDGPGAGATVKCAGCGGEVPVPAGDAAFEQTGAIRSSGFVIGDEKDVQMDETRRLEAKTLDPAMFCGPAPGNGGSAAAPVAAKARTSSDERRAAALGKPDEKPGTAAKPAAEPPPLEKGRCPLCGLRGRADDVICVGCGTNLATGEPPPVERFRPRRFDTRIAVVAGILVLLGLAGLGVAKLARSGADRRAVQRGQALARADDWKGAEEQFREAVDLNPENAKAWAALAEARVRLGGSLEPAGDAAERALKSGAQGADAAVARYALGRVRLAQNRLDDASKALEDAAKDRGDLPGLKHFLGHVRYLRKEGAVAIAVYEQALAGDPGSPEAPTSRLHLGALYTERGKFEDAEKMLNKALADGGPKAEALAALGDLYAKMGKPDAALASYLESVKADERVAWTHFKIARLRFRASEVPAALDAVGRAMSLDPNEPEFYKLEGRLREAAGDPGRAAEAYRAAAQRSKRDPEPWLLAAKLDAARGEDAKARESLSLALDMDRGYYPALVELGDLLARRKDWHGAVDAYKRALDADPTKADVAFRQGRALEETGQAADALNAYRRAVEIDANHRSAWERMADMYQASGRKDDTATALESLCRLKPDDTASRVALAKLRLEAKRYDAAKRLLEEVLGREPAHGEAKKLLDKVELQRFMEQQQ